MIRAVCSKGKFLEDSSCHRNDCKFTYELAREWLKLSSSLYASNAFIIGNNCLLLETLLVNLLNRSWLLALHRLCRFTTVDDRPRSLRGVSMVFMTEIFFVAGLDRRLLRRLSSPVGMRSVVAFVTMPAQGFLNAGHASGDAGMEILT